MNTSSLWKKTIDEIRLEVSEATFSSFFKKTKIQSFENGRLIISCPNNGIGFVLQNKYQDIIIKTVKKYCGQKPRDLSFKIKEASPYSKKDAPLFVDKKETLITRATKANLSPKLTFDNFAVSVSNQLAHAAALAVADNPGAVYNPLFIWGGVGVGKTHLLNAIGKRAVADNKKKIVYCSTEDFTNSLVEAIRNKSTRRFRHKYRQLDLFLLDDVQFVSQREFVQEELFHTFNQLRQQNKQVVFASDKPPSHIRKIEKRLISRFLSGLVVDIQTPDFELKTAIILIKSKEKGLLFGIETAKIISSHFEEVREIEGFLLKLEMYKNGGQKVNKELVEKVLVQNQEEHGRKTNPKEIISIISKETGIKQKQLKGENRKQQVVLARHLTMYFLKTQTTLSYEEIAHLLGKKDHTTVMHGVQKIINQAPKDNLLRQQIESIKTYFF